MFSESLIWSLACVTISVVLQVVEIISLPVSAWWREQYAAALVYPSVLPLGVAGSCPSSRGALHDSHATPTYKLSVCQSGLTGRAPPCNMIPQSQPRPRCGSWIENAECSALLCRRHAVVVPPSSLTPVEGRLWINDGRNPSGETWDLVQGKEKTFTHMSLLFLSWKLNIVRNTLGPESKGSALLKPCLKILFLHSLRLPYHCKKLEGDNARNHCEHGKGASKPESRQSQMSKPMFPTENSDASSEQLNNAHPQCQSHRSFSSFSLKFVCYVYWVE